MNRVIPANASFAHKFSESGFTVTFASGSFFVSINSGAKLKISTGQTIGTRTGPALGRVEFSNSTATDILISIGAYGASVTMVPPDLKDVIPVNAYTNPFLYNWWDNSAGAHTPDQDPITIPKDKPFRRIWTFFEAGTFPNDEVVSLDFTLDSQAVLSLVVWLKATLGTTQYGIGMNAAVDNGNRVAAANSIFFRNGAGGTYYELYPFDTYVVADTVTMNKTSGIGGTIRAYLGIMSTEVKV